MKIASLQYSYDFPKSFEEYEKKISRLVQSHAAQGVQMLLFPEYAGMEMLSFAPRSLQSYIPAYLRLFQSLSAKHQIFICSGSQFVTDGGKTFNRSYLFSPNQKIGHQDKCVITPYEVDEGILSQGTTLQLFETHLGKIAICICYDVEFPSIVNILTQAGAKILLVPSYTSSIHGFYRVFLSCRARALENQCYVIQSALIGQTDVEIAHGASAICSPIDDGFPEDGLLALGKIDQIESVIGTLNLSQLDSVRLKGQTRNYLDQQILHQKRPAPNSVDLR